MCTDREGEASLKALIEHLVNEHWDEVVSKSLLHCHARNLHSLMLLDTPEKRIRMFVTDTGHTLHLNEPEAVLNGQPMSIAFHSHHCNITLAVLRGTLTNWLVWEPSTGRSMPLTCFRYRSAITGGEGAGFERLGDVSLSTRRIDTFFDGESVYLDAKDIHTVAVPVNDVTAWLVLEGKEDPDYQPTCYSNTNLEAEDFSGLYEKPSESDCRELLKMAGVRCA